MDELVVSGHVDAKWKKQSHGGMVTDSVVVFVVRDGNPKKIKSWDDLLRPASRSSPRTRSRPAAPAGTSWLRTARGASGQDREAGSGEPARAVQERVVQDKSARDSLNTFHRARATSCSRTRTRLSSADAGPGPSVRHPAPDDPDREPDRRPEEEPEQARRRTRSCAS